MSVCRRALFVLAIAALAALLPVASASAATTKVVISLKFPAFHGTLQSSKHACVKHRTVKLYRVKPGPDKVLKTDTSEDNGSWSTPVGKKLSSGGYYAKAVARGSCQAAKSKVLSID